MLRSIISARIFNQKQGIIRCFVQTNHINNNNTNNSYNNNSNNCNNNDIDEELYQYMHGRKNSERRDSVTKEILLERKQHNERIAEIDVNTEFVRSLESAGLGNKKKRRLVYSNLPPHMQEAANHTRTGAGGFAVHVTSASKDWPIFKHLLPEIAFAGHSNSGKSTLVNAIAGLAPRKGPAGVSERAGWTDQICFYQLGKRPPLFTLADLPGYGHAVATALDKRHWMTMNKNYLSTRPILSRCCILVDCTRGLCSGDLGLIKYLIKYGVEWQIVLTKCDLLNPLELAQSITAVELDIVSKIEPKLLGRISSDIEFDIDSSGAHYRLVAPVSASTGAGIGELWSELVASAEQTSVLPGGNRSEAPENSFPVREHVKAGEVRRQRVVK